MTEYEDLAFKPELTWMEFWKEYHGNDETRFVTFSPIPKVKLIFWKDGNIFVDYTDKGVEAGFLLAENKTPAQMKTIIEALWG